MVTRDFELKPLFNTVQVGRSNDTLQFGQAWSVPTQMTAWEYQLL